MGIRKKLSIFLVYIWLVALTVKDYQEYYNVRLLSTFLPMIILGINYKFISLVKISKVVIIYLIIIFSIPIYDILSGKNFNFYPLYLDICVINAVIILSILFYVLNRGFASIAKMYVNSIIAVCLLSYLTLEEQWFGGLSIRSFSDFPTFFALQVSVAVPFIAGKRMMLKRVFLLVTLFFTFSRVSFLLSLFSIIFQYFKQNKLKSINFILATLVIGAILIQNTLIGQIMVDKFQNFAYLIVNDDVKIEEINPSDLGRLAYASTTLSSLNSPYKLLFGHGIKSNVQIIEDNLDIKYWGLDESMRNATVHNLYLEILSDFGVIGLSIFSLFIFYILYNLSKKYGLTSAFCISFLIFIATYIFEPNYVSFFFQFFIIFNLMASSIPVNLNALEHTAISK